MWKPVLSAANHVRSIFIPPKGRTATCPFGSRLQGQPQCSILIISRGASFTNSSTASWSANQFRAGNGVVDVVFQTIVRLDDRS